MIPIEVAMDKGLMNWSYTSEGVYAREKINKVCCNHERRGNSSIRYFVVYYFWSVRKSEEERKYMRWSGSNGVDPQNTTTLMRGKRLRHLLFLSRCTRGMSGPSSILLFIFLKPLLLTYLFVVIVVDCLPPLLIVQVLYLSFSFLGF